MSETQQRPQRSGSGQAPSYPVNPVNPVNPTYPDVEGKTTGWTGFVVFAGTLLIMLGGFQAIEGLVAIFKDTYYLVTANGLVVNVNYSAWGWTHLIVGLIAIAAGIGVLAGQTWARVLGIIIAAVSALVNIAFLSAYPIWSIIVIAIDVLAIYALAVHGREVVDS